MIYTRTEIPDIWIIEPKIFGDERGYFMETYKKTEFEQYIGPCDFIQDNESCSVKGVWRGLHYQLAPFAQSKLVRVIQGTIIDVAVDIRKGSPTFGKFTSITLSGENKRQLFVPKGFAHGFYVTSDKAVFTYKVDNPYVQSLERVIRYDDPEIGLGESFTWEQSLIVSEKDRQAPLLKDAEINYQFPI